MLFVLLILSCKYDAEKNIFTSRHEILATGCIHAPAMASNLFRREAFRTAFHFDLDVVSCFFVVEVSFVVFEDDIDFEFVCVVPECAGAA
jgi:hypothetical protein